MLLISNKNHITTITLNRPEKSNALDDHFIAELTDAFSTISKDNNTHAVIFNANGKHFSAGADLNYMQRMVNFSDKENHDDAIKLGSLFQTINTCPKPIIASVHGAAYGGGSGLVACCDMVIASQDTHFCFSEVKFGLAPATIAPYVINKIGHSAARHYFLSAEVFYADIAKEIGLINQIVPNEQLEAAVQALAEEVAKHDAYAMQKTKELLNHLHPTNNGLMEKTAKLIAELRTKPEAQKRLKAFFV